MKIVAIIQARMGSSRLPGKILEPIGIRSMLGRVVNRTSQARKLSEVVVATTYKALDDAVVNECQLLSVPFIRGSELDVLDRYYQAALNRSAEAIVRITGDCPFIDPSVVDRVIHVFLAMKPDYASNTVNRTYPRGLDVEVFSMESLEIAWRLAILPYQRVHVTPFFFDDKRFRIQSVEEPIDNSQYRLTVDTEEDLVLARELYSRLEDPETFHWQEVIRILETEPNLVEINRMIAQKNLHEG